jgi:hypothetical protein
MEKNLTIVFCLVFISGVAQEKDFLLNGRILNPDSIPVENAYIINFRDQSVYLSRADGRFTLMVKDGDSLMVSHLSFQRKKIFADRVMLNPEIILEYDTIMIKQVDVGTDPEKLSKIVDKNMNPVRNMEIIIYRRINPGASLVNQTMIENNRILRSEASSVSMVRFSPSYLISRLVKNSNKKQKEKGFNFYKDKAEKERKDGKKAE